MSLGFTNQGRPPPRKTQQKVVTRETVIDTILPKTTSNTTEVCALKDNAVGKIQTSLKTALDSKRTIPANNI